MLEDRHDWLLVQLDELADAVRTIAARVLEVDTENDDEDQLAETEAKLDDMLEQHFEHARMAVTDARTAAMILRPPGRIRAYAQLLAHKATLEGKRGRADVGHALARRALELQLEATALEPDLDKSDHDAIAALLEREPPPRLGARHQQLLDELLSRLKT